ncbi:MAG: thiamine pyrophosphate-binding protein [Candidatus Gastranaerophilales bacterium]
MRQMTVNQFLVKELNRLDIVDFFGLPGDYNFHILEAIEQNKKTNWIGCTNELNAGYSADGYARINGFAALVTTYGVGELSAMNAIAGAYAENVAVMNIVGMPSTNEIVDNKVLHHNFIQPNYYACSDAYSNFVQASVILNKYEALEQMKNILSIFIKERKPVYIGIPKNIGEMVVDVDDVMIEVFQSDEKKLQQALEHFFKVFEKSANPVILGDILIERFASKDVFKDFVLQMNIPVTTLLMGKGLVDERYDKFLGTYLGMVENVQVYNKVSSSDCVISVGTIFSDFNTMDFDIPFRSSDFVEIQGTYTIIEQKIYEDILMKDILSAIVKSISLRKKVVENNVSCPIGSNYSADENFKSMSVDKENKIWEQKEVSLNFEYFTNSFQEFLKKDDIIIADTGMITFSLPLMNFPCGCLFISQLLWGAIGWATPATFGVGCALGKNEKRVILLTGEGSHQLTFQSVSNMIKNRQKPIIFILNNSGYAIERVLSDNSNDNYNDVISWDYTKLIKAFSDEIWSAKVYTNLELDSALEEANLYHGDKLCYIELFIDKNDYPYLMKKMLENKRFKR